MIRDWVVSILFLLVFVLPLVALYLFAAGLIVYAAFTASPLLGFASVCAMLPMTGTFALLLLDSDMGI